MITLNVDCSTSLSKIDAANFYGYWNTSDSWRLFNKEMKLTNRENQVLKLTSFGNSNKMIASILAIKERTVEFHKTNIYKKCQLESISDMIIFGINKFKNDN